MTDLVGIAGIGISVISDIYVDTIGLFPNGKALIVGDLPSDRGRSLADKPGVPACAKSITLLDRKSQ